MRTTIRTTRGALLAAASLLALASPAAAQYWPGSPIVTGPSFGPGGAGFGAGQYLQGSASVINASGNLTLQNEQARIMREQANQAKLETQKKAFDLRRYEDANTPKFTEVEEKNQAMRLRRVMNQPLTSEIVNGKALNIMLPYMASIADRGTLGRPTQLDPEIVRRINLTGPDGGNPGLLRSTQLDWPLALQGDLQQEIDLLYQQALIQTANGKLDPKLFAQLRKQSRGLNQIVLDKLGANELDGASYLAAKRFITAFDSALEVLAQPGASRVVGGQFQARGNTVQELVQNMTRQGLQFAPANPGDGNYYVALHSAMVSFANSSADADAAFRMRVGVSQPGAGTPGK